MKDILKLENVFGPVKSLITPSGHTVVIRQQNGEDDDTLSNGAAVNSGISTVNFLSDIIIDSSYTEKGKLTPKEVCLIRLPDVYFILISSRIFSLGNILNFEYKWPGDEIPISYEEDLYNYIWDYSQPFPSELSDENYYKFKIKPITEELTRKITLRSGKVIIYTMMNPKGEMYLMKLPQDKQSKNQELLARSLKMETSTGYTDVYSFKFFSPQDMIDIRNDVMVNDPILEIYTEIPNPKTGDTILYPILGTTDFFFPRGI
jgi:hypothetical protein